MSSRKKITIGELGSIPVERVGNYNFWSIAQTTPIYHGAYGYASGIDMTKPLNVTLESNFYIEGLRAIPMGGLATPDHARQNSQNANPSLVQATLYQAPMNAGLSGQTAISPGDTALEIELTGGGSASLGDWDPAGASNCSGEAASYDTRYRLSCGLSLSRPKNVLLDLFHIAAFSGGKNPLNIFIGDEAGMGWPINRTGLESLLVECTIGPNNPVYAYVKSDLIPLPSDEEAHNLPVDHCLVFIRSDATDGSTVVTDSSLYAKPLFFSGISHTEQTRLFGNTALRFEHNSSYIEVDNTLDDLMAYDDFTIRFIAKADKLGLRDAQRLFKFDDNYLDISAPCKIEGVICGAVIKGFHPQGDWTDWTAFCLSKKDGVVSININGMCVASESAGLPFGGSVSYTADVANTTGTVLDMGGNVYAASRAFDDRTDYLPWRNDQTNITKTIGYDFGENKVIGKYAMSLTTSYSHYNNYTTCPRNWEFQGSNDGVNWTALDTRQGQSWTGWRSFELRETGEYEQYRLYITKTNRSDVQVHIHEFDMYERLATSNPVSLIVGTDDSAVISSFIGVMEDFQFCHTAVPDALSRLAENTGYLNPGLDNIPLAQMSSLDRDGYKFKEEEFSLIALTAATASSSNAIAGFEASNAIDGDSLTYWDSGVGAGTSVQIDSTRRFSRACRYTLAIPAGRQADAPSSWILEGHDGSAWTTLDSRTGIVAWLDSESKTFSFYRPDRSYRSYRLTVNAVDGGTSACLSNFDVLDHSRFTLDEEYVQDLNPDRATAAGVRNGERHASANTGWDLEWDTEALALGGSFLRLQKPSMGQIIIDNTGKASRAQALVYVAGLSWPVAPTITDEFGQELKYRFISTTYTTSTTVDSGILIRVDLIADSMMWLDVDLSAVTVDFLDESEVLLDTSENGDTHAYIDLTASVDTILLEGIDQETVDGQMADYYLAQVIPSGTYLAWSNIYSTPNYYNRHAPGPVSAKSNAGYVVFGGGQNGNTYASVGKFFFRYSSHSNTAWRVASILTYSYYFSYGSMCWSGNYWAYGGTEYSSVYRPYLHEYTEAMNVWYRRADATLSFRHAAMYGIGSEIWLFGGNNASGTSDVVQHYDSITNIWTATGSMDMARNKQRGGIYEGDVSTVGGDQSSVAGQCDLLRYYPASDTFQVINNNCDCGYLTQHDADVNNQYMYLHGGQNASGVANTNVWIVDMTSDTFASDPTGGMTRKYHCFKVFDNYYFEYGANDSTANVERVYTMMLVNKDFARFDERSDLGALEYKCIRSVHAGFRNIDARNYLFVTGGSDGLVDTAHTQLWDVESRQWIPLQDCPIAHSGAAGGIYQDSSGKPIGIVWFNNELYEYDFSQRTWSLSISVTDAASQLAVGDFGHALHTTGGKTYLYMYGGRDAGGVVQDQFVSLNLTDRILVVPTTNGVIVPALADTNGAAAVSLENDSFVVYGGTTDDITYLNVAYKLDITTLEWTGNTPTTAPAVGLTMGSLYNDPSIDIDQYYMILRDNLGDMYQLDFDTLSCELVIFDGVPPVMGDWGILTGCSYLDVLDAPFGMLGYGDIDNGTIGLAYMGHRPIEMEISLNTPVTPRSIRIGFEYYAGINMPVEIQVSGFNGTEWNELAYIPSGVVTRSGATYNLDNADTLTALKILYHCGAGTGDTPLYITGVSLIGDTKYGRVVDQEIEIYKSGVEVLATTLTKDANEQIVPTTNFGSYGSRQPVVQTYIIKDVGLTGMYSAIPAIPSIYPYSVKYTTTDFNRIELDIDKVDHMSAIAGGNVQLAFSFDGRTTWQVYSGGAWVPLDISVEANFVSSGMTIDDVLAVPLTSWDAYAGAGKFVDVSVLLTLTGPDDNSYFNTLMWATNDYTLGARRIISPYNTWLNVLLNNGTSANVRTLTDIENSVPTKTFNCFDWAHGYHPWAVQTTELRSLDLSSAYMQEECECAWVAMDSDGHLPTKMGHSTAANGSFLRMAGILEYFEYSTETLTLLTAGISYATELGTHRRAYGKDGKIVMTYGETAGSTEILEASTGTLISVNTTGREIRGNGATLASDTSAWLTPGNLALSTEYWYNAVTKVDYADNNTNYANQRCSFPSLMSSKSGGVSDLHRGWVVGQADLIDTYQTVSLDYANDTAGIVPKASFDVAALPNSNYASIGCSSPTMNCGYFHIYHQHIEGALSRPMLKLRYSDDTVFSVHRIDSTIGGDYSNTPNPQARSVGDSKIYFWNNNADKIGPLAIDLSTDTGTHRAQGTGSTQTNYESGACGAQSCGINY